MASLSTVYATDEDIAIRAAADFWILCPRDQRVAAGTDGAFNPGDPWTLCSATVDISACGAAAGQVVLLTKPSSSFRPPGDFLVVDSASSNGVVLRRKGLPTRSGQAPGGATGMTNVEFAVVTLRPQIEDACYDLNRRFGVDDVVTGRSASRLYDPREIREATVLTVLYRQYLSMSREAGDQGDTFATKALAIKSELDDLLSRVVLHWLGSAGSGTSELGTTHFSTRLAR